MATLWFNNQKEWRKKLKMFFWNNRYHNCKSRGVHKEGERASSGGQETENKVSFILSSNYNWAYNQAQAIKKQRQVENARVALNWFLCSPSWTRGNVKRKSSAMFLSFDNCLNVVQVYQRLQQVQKSRGCSCCLDLHVTSLFNRIYQHQDIFSTR